MTPHIDSVRPLVFGFVVAGIALIGACAASAGKHPPQIAPHANLDAGIQALEAEDYEKAMQQLEIAIVADPKNPEAFYRLAQTHRALGNYRRALKYIRLALEIEPNHLGALKERGIVLLEAGQPEEAKVTLEQLGDKCDRSCPEYKSLKQQVEAAPTKKDS